MRKSPAQTYQDIAKDKIDYEFLRNKLRLKQLGVKASFSQKYPHVEKYLKTKGIELGKLREHSAKIISAGALTGTLLLTPPAGVKSLPTPTELIKSLEDFGQNIASEDFPKKFMVDKLAEALPSRTRPLDRGEEKYLETVFENILGVKIRANLEGEHLNTIYGLIGAEQHLKRYPGDVLTNHRPLLQEGIAPELGAWGYFAPSKKELTANLESIERWYAVVQTLYLPDWNRRQPYLRDWYKYRKVLIVNTHNGNAVVTAIADSGPAAWTGKHFGGSPEMMEYLGGPRYKKGPVLVFFVDDPENKVPLGPVDYNKVRLPELALVSS